MRTIDAERLSAGSEGKVCRGTLVLLSPAWAEQVLPASKGIWVLLSSSWAEQVLPASSCMVIVFQVEGTEIL